MSVLKFVANGNAVRVVPKENLLKNVRVTHRMSKKGLWERIEPEEALKFKFVELVAENGVSICSGSEKKSIFYVYDDSIFKGNGGQLMLGDYNE